MKVRSTIHRLKFEGLTDILGMPFHFTLEPSAIRFDDIGGLPITKKEKGKEKMRSVDEKSLMRVFVRVGGRMHLQYDKINRYDNDATVQFHYYTEPLICTLILHPTLYVIKFFK